MSAKSLIARDRLTCPIQGLRGSGLSPSEAIKAFGRLPAALDWEARHHPTG